MEASCSVWWELKIARSGLWEAEAMEEATLLGFMKIVSTGIF